MLDLGFNKDDHEKDLDTDRKDEAEKSPWHDSEVGPQPDDVAIPFDRFSSEDSDVFHDSELGEQPEAIKAPSLRLSGSDLSAVSEQPPGETVGCEAEAPLSHRGDKKKTEIAIPSSDVIQDQPVV